MGCIVIIYLLSLHATHLELRSPHLTKYTNNVPGTGLDCPPPGIPAIAGEEAGFLFEHRKHERRSGQPRRTRWTSL